MIKIEIEDNKFIEFDEQTRTFFYGSNQRMKQQLIRSLKRFSAKKALNDLEKIVYGENGIEIYRDDQLLSARDIDLYILQDNSSIFNEIDFKKNSLMENYLKAFNEEIETHTQLEEIKNHLLQLETLFNKKMCTISNNISLNLTDLTFEELLKNHLFLSFYDKGHDYPLEMIDAGELVDEYTKLLSYKIAHEPKETWVVLVNPESYLSQENIKALLNDLDKISAEGKLLKTFVISKYPLDLYYNCFDVSGTVILADETYQMPEFDDFKHSIENHYPNQLSLSDEELCQAFFQVVSHIGAEAKNSGITASNMVLLKVIDEILGFTNLSFSVKLDDITDAEKSFLLSSI